MKSRAASGVGDTLEVHLDAEFTNGPVRVGTLSNDRGQVRFVYADEWLEYPEAFQIDPSLTLDKATFFPDPRQSNFGIFLDSSPDRWGQKLMDRRERIVALDQKRPVRKLQAWDYLVGVQDVTRMGALRFKEPGDSPFLDNHDYPAPPITSLPELESIAADLSSTRVEPPIAQLRKWLGVLVAPGASLGGARPKANYRDKDGSLWIAKFPSRDDTRDHALWELLAHDMAVDAGIDCPAAVVKRFDNAFHTFCIKRFDRTADRRHFFVSAMTALRKADGTDGSYLDLVGFIDSTGADKDAIATDLAELYRRVVFNALIGNCDDHLRNHGFFIGRRGWRLAPAYDMNPGTDVEHVLSFDGYTKTPTIDILIETAVHYGLDATEARDVIAEISAVVAKWRTRARRRGIAADDIELMGDAFALAATAP